MKKQQKNNQLVETNKNKHIKIKLIDDSSNVQDPSKLDKTMKHCVIFDDCVNDRNQFREIISQEVDIITVVFFI